MGSAVERCHQLLRRHLRPGQRCIDATAGRGRDARLLLELVGPAGQVLALDVQPEAVAATLALLNAPGLPQGQLRVLLGDHSQLDSLAGQDWLGQVAAVVFNLGYLPGSDQRLITRPESTLPALAAALRLLAPEGLLLVVVYPGHPGGAEEAQAVEAWLTARSGVEIAWLPETEFASGPYQPGAPRLLAARRTPLP